MVPRKLCRKLNEREKLNSSLLVIEDLMLLKSLFKYWTYQVFSPGTVSGVPVPL
jgi:hypothetical protein